ncbi:sensor histidine kinase [Enterococcus sp. HY326]|uniref:sensor histidine kinase n=1 Tax=Enterococcus sp. HY326 TaxID=2971265 RepID=UPI00223F8D61|nr:ATP-binding protein [Enterococcus sp. HY326]
MRKPSNKWIYVGFISVLIITAVGLTLSIFTYSSVQRHSMKLAEEHLTTINNDAIKILTLQIENYREDLENLSRSEELTASFENLNDELLDKELSHALSSMATLSLVTDNGLLIKGWQKKGQQLEALETFPRYVMTDPDYPTGVKTSGQENGQVFYDYTSSYLNFYQKVTDSSQNQAILILTIDLEKFYQENFDPLQNDFQGYTMIKDQDMKVAMHPSTEQVGLTIVEDRQQEFPDLDYTDLKRLETEQLANQKGTLSYYSYWWTEENPTRVLKIAAYQWITIGATRLVVASNSDFNEWNGLVIEGSMMSLGLLIILFVVLVLLGFIYINNTRKNRNYQENLRLKERQRSLEEKHAMEKSIFQESKLETIGLLTTTIVHDMNNFLTPMIGNLQLLIEEHQDDELLVDDLKEVYQAAEKGQQLSSNVLRFSKVNQGQKKNQQIDEVVKEALDTLKLLIPKTATLTYELNTNQSAYFEKDDLQVILYNLITNAYQAIDQTGAISVKLSLADAAQNAAYQKTGHVFEKKSFALLEITDDGPGIPKDIEEHIFTPFFTTKSTDGGTGLGLFTVSSIVKKNDWFLNVESSPAGTTFILAIPF